MPQRAPPGRCRAPAGEGDGNRTLCDLSSPAGDQDGTRGRAHAGARRQDVVLVVPQPARLDQQREGAACRQLGVRELHELPRRDARTDAVGARARPRELHDLPRSARIVERSHAGRPACRCSVSVATSRRDIRRRSTTTTRSLNKSNRMFGRSCVNCHSNIHGSNHPSGQFFMR